MAYFGVYWEASSEREVAQHEPGKSSATLSKAFRNPLESSKIEQYASLEWNRLRKAVRSGVAKLAAIPHFLHMERTRREITPVTA